jgi:hypothetical protein
VQVFKTIWDIRALFGNPVDISLFVLWLVIAVLFVRSSIRRLTSHGQSCMDLVWTIVMGVVGVLSLFWILLQYLDYFLHWGLLQRFFAVIGAYLAFFFGYGRGFR